MKLIFWISFGIWKIKTPGGQVLIFELFYGIGEFLPEVKWRFWIFLKFLTYFRWEKIFLKNIKWQDFSMNFQHIFDFKVQKKFIIQDCLLGSHPEFLKAF